MDICEQCFWESETISSYIKEQGDKQTEMFTCRACNREDSEYLIDRNALQDKLQNIISDIYSHEHQHGLAGSAGMQGIDSASFLSDLYDVCGNLFDTSEENLIQLICENNSHDSFFLDPYEIVWIDIRCDWEGSEHHNIKWDDFSELVKYKARFFDHEQADRGPTLDRLRSIFEKFVVICNEEKIYRARKITSEKVLGKITEDPLNELGQAPKRISGYNRFSPAGISYIYLADNIQTASAEIRSQVGDNIAIGEFSINDLRLVNISNETLKIMAYDYFHDDFCPEIRAASSYIESFIEEISKPLSESDKLIDYVPTQIISEFIWSLGYDGFMFPSSLSEGTNYVLFDVNYELVNWKKYKVSSLKVDQFI